MTGFDVAEARRPEVIRQAARRDMSRLPKDYESHDTCHTGQLQAPGVRLAAPLPNSIHSG
jgi:hypothetical protein